VNDGSNVHALQSRKDCSGYTFFTVSIQLKICYNRTNYVSTWLPSYLEKNLGIGKNHECACLGQIQQVTGLACLIRSQAPLLDDWIHTNGNADIKQNNTKIGTNSLLFTKTTYYHKMKENLYNKRTLDISSLTDYYLRMHNLLIKCHYS
jgi:hypothetical protein